MKKQYLIILILIITNLIGFSQISSNGTGGGVWSDDASWFGGIKPISTDNVIIVSGDVITVSSTQACKDLTINSGGTLTVQTGATFSTSSTIFVEGILTMSGGILNAGGSKTKYLQISGSGASFSFSGGTINVSGRYKQLNGANAYLSSDGILNISTAGQQTAGISSFSVTTSGEFSVEENSSVQIVLKNGNTGSTVDLYYSPTTSNFLGGSIIVENATNESDIYIDSDEPIYKIESKVGSGSVFHFGLGCDFNLTNFTITSGTAQADANSKINITGTASLGADDKLTLASGASVIFAAAPTEKITVQRTLTNSAWHYISSPIADTRTFASNTSLNLVSGDFFYRFDETTNDGSWVQIYPTGGTGAMTEQFTAGQGYAMEYNNGDNTIAFNGTIRTGDVGYNLTKTGSLTNNGYNLTGNPYQAMIIANNDGNSLLNENLTSLDATNAALYFWDQTQSDYSAINNTDSKTRIAVGQGFMVRAKSNGESFTYKTIMQENGTNNFYKNTQQDNWVRTRFRLSNSQNLINDILIGFKDGMTKGLDIGYDAGKFKGNSNIALYSSLVDNSQTDGFATQALPLFLTEPVSVDIGFDLTEIGDFTFSLTDFEYGFDSVEMAEATIELEDTYLKTVVDLKSNDYYFHLNSTGSFNDRFVLHFNRNLLSVISPFEITKNEFLVYSRNDNTIVVKNVGNIVNEDLNIRVVEITGRVLYEERIRLAIGESYVAKPITTSKVLLVIVTGSEQTSTKKIILK